MEIGPGTSALVTGASRGIGRALAAELAARGIRLGLVARGREGLDELIAWLPAPPEGEHMALAADVGRRSQVEKAVERFAKSAGGLDLAIANAGIAHYGAFADQDLGQIEEMIKINVLGAVYTVRAALAEMLPRARGHIVVVSSGAGLRAFPSGAVYGGTKAFDRGFAEALRHELSGTGVDLTTVFPGEVETDLHTHQPDRIPDWRRSSAAIPPADVARPIIEAVEQDRRSVFAPGNVRALGLNGVAPRLTDRLLAALRGGSAAPRRD
jgi:short-subunit dehydrogenase